MIRRVLSVMAVIVSPAVLAKPVNLHCEFDNRGKALPMEVALDEDAGTASYFWPLTNTSVKDPANFLPSKVLFSSFTIDRTSLAIDRAAIAVDIPAITGRCVLAKVERAF